MALRTVTLLLCLLMSACGQKGPLYFADGAAPAEKAKQTPEKTRQQTDREEDEQQ